MRVFVLAASTWNDLKDTDVATIRSLEGLFKNAVGAVMAFVGIALFVMLVTGGFRFLLSGGDGKKLEAAKSTMTSAIMGLVVILVALLILRTVATFTGLDDQLLQFSIPR